MANLQYITDEYGGPDNIDWSRVVYRCATCALLTSPAGSRLSVALGLNTTDALETMGYEDDDGEEAAAFISDRMYFQNRERTSTDATYPLQFPRCGRTSAGPSGDDGRFGGLGVCQRSLPHRTPTISATCSRRVLVFID